MARDDGRVRVAERLVEEWDTACRIAPVEVHVNALRGLLTALVAAEAERDAAVREVQLMQGSFAAVTAERDEARAEVTRLAALETAAIAYRAWWVAYDGLEGNLVEGHRLLTELRQATAALAAPAGQPS